MRYLLLASPLALFACADEKIELGGGAGPDARLQADIYTWECEDTTAGTRHEGVFGFQISMEYAPDALTEREAPRDGCKAGLDLFARDAGSGALDIPGVSRPGWSSGSLTGTLDHEGSGFYHDNAFDNRSGCTAAEDLGDGTSLSDAGSFSGATAPSPGTIDDVTLAGEVNEESGIPFGASVTASWVASGWDRAWVQVRREKDGAVAESVTCAAVGDEYTLDEEAWGLLNSALEADVTNLYVAFQVDGSSMTEDGQEILTQTRALHVAVVND